MKLGRFIKSSGERKRYTLDYGDWLDTGETVLSTVFSVSPASALEVDASSISSDGTEVAFFVSGGTSGIVYTVGVAITTSSGQVKEDQVYFSVRND